MAARASIFAPVSAMKALEWSGIGELPTERGLNRLVLKTRVEPFLRARTTSWFENDEPESARTLIVEPDGAWVESKGARKRLPDRQAAHERAQYGLYGYMLEAMQPGASSRLAHAGLPSISFTRDAAGRLMGADYTVPDHASEGVLAQRIEFEGMVADGGVNWPRRITLAARDAPPGQFDFRIALDDFTAIPA